MIMFNIETIVNEYFDHVYLLNLDRRPDRLQQTSKKLEKLNVKFERFSAIDGDNLKINYKTTCKIHGKINNVMGCLLSHYHIIKNAKEKNYKRILILEDDIMISEKFNKYFQKVKELDDWKLLYLGASQFDWADLEYKNSFYLCKKTYGMFACGIDNSIFDEILNYCEHYINDNIVMEIDTILVENIQKKYYQKCFTLFPNVIIANLLDSDIRFPAKNTDYLVNMKWNTLNDFE